MAKHYELDESYASHPLRESITPEELKRIYEAYESDDLESLTITQLQVLEDIIFDFHAANTQTHPGYLILH